MSDIELGVFCIAVAIFVFAWLTAIGMKLKKRKKTDKGKCVAVVCLVSEFYHVLTKDMNIDLSKCACSARIVATEDAMYCCVHDTDSALSLTFTDIIVACDALNNDRLRCAYYEVLKRLAIAGGARA